MPDFNEMRSLSRSMKLLCRRFNDLQQRLVEEQAPNDQDNMTGSIGPPVGNLPFDELLLEIDSDAIRQLCRDKAIWWRGLDYFMQGRVTNMSVHWDMIQARVRGKSKPYYDTQARFWRMDEKGFRASLSCNCLAFRDNKRCKHIVALLVAWARKPQSFTICEECFSPSPNYEMFDIKSRTDKLLELVEDIAQASKESSWREDFEMLQNLHAMMRNLARLNKTVSPQHYYTLSHTASIIYVAIFALIDKKYGLDITALYNNAVSDLMAKLMERFVDTSRKDSNRTVLNVENLCRTEPAKMVEASQVVTAHPSRSWDSIVDEFRKQVR